MKTSSDNNGRKGEFDCKGYLVDPLTWDPGLRDLLAKEENVVLNEEHHLVILFLRSYYEENAVHPVIRMITAAMAKSLGPEKGTSKYFHSLFPAGINQAFRIAGLPVKHSCC